MHDLTAPMQTPSAATLRPEVSRKGRLRLWPGLLLAALVPVSRVVATTGELSPLKFFVGLIVVPFVALVGMLLWWLFASRVSWRDGFLVLGSFVGVTAATVLAAGSNFPAFPLILYALPVIVIAWPVWLLLTGMLSWSVRLAGVVGIFLITGVVCAQLRVDGMYGDFDPQFSWRWSLTAEQKLVAERKAKAEQKKAGLGEEVRLTASNGPLQVREGDWPGFRGPGRDSRVVGVQIGTDWDKTPPRELWRQRVGPGWSSFAVIGDRLYTQEQVGDEEFVICYDANTGKDVWSHKNATRFEEVIAGAGPRATPTFHEGRIYALGANGLLNCLDAETGEPVWSKDIAAETGAKVPQWGFSSSPLVAHGLVSVFAGGPDGKAVVAFHADNGDRAWMAGNGTQSYCSPQLLRVDDTEQLLISTEVGTQGFDPKTGKVLWTHDWPTPVARVVQPALVGTHDILLGTGLGVGTRRFSVTRNNDDWQTKEVWTTRTIKPYYNDFVLFEDHLYGLDSNFLMCINLEDGSSKWRARGNGAGYGNGQMLLLVDQGLLLILCEKGDVALVRAQPGKHEEIARFKALEGKTWNHPVVAHGKLFVRNGETMACFALPGKE